MVVHNSIATFFVPFKHPNLLDKGVSLSAVELA